MRVMNLMEPMVAEVLEQYWNQVNNSCSCGLCKNDVLAIALNSLPTRYVATAKGETIQRVKLMDEQAHADILRELAKAMQIVAQKPSHD